MIECFVLLALEAKERSYVVNTIYRFGRLFRTNSTGGDGVTFHSELTAAVASAGGLGMISLYSI